jgi:hypothetical protein
MRGSNWTVGVALAMCAASGATPAGVRSPAAPGVATHTAGAVPATADELSPLRCRLSARPAAIDGRLDDDCWRRADVASGFVLLEGRGRATQHTECMTAYDAENLYVAFTCHESNPRFIRAHCTTRDGVVWRDDCVEVFLDTRHDHRTYFHLIVNQLGTQFDEIGPVYPRPESWDGAWRVATQEFEGGWNVEMAIPFRALGLPTPPPGTLWGFNVNRQEYRLLERSSWAATVHSFHEPAHFGHLLFVPSA